MSRATAAATPNRKTPKIQSGSWSPITREATIESTITAMSTSQAATANPGSG